VTPQCILATDPAATGGRAFRPNITFESRTFSGRRPVSEIEEVTATSGDRSASFTLHWYEHHWTCTTEFDLADFPFIALVGGKRFELYSDGTFDEEELSRRDEPSPQ
jgi:hypothetical protein